MRSFYLLSYILCFSATVSAQSFAPDPSFGNNGVVFTPETNATSLLNDAAFQNDGKIVATGMFYEQNGMLDYHLFLVRYNNNGSLDSSFGDNGKVKTVVGTKDYGMVLAIQSDGKIVVAGNELIIDAIDSTSATITSRPFIARYNSTGSLDSTFGVDGIHRLGILNAFDTRAASTMMLRPDGSIVIGGNVAIGQELHLFLLSLTSNGNYDNSFGTNGLQTSYFEQGKNTVLYDIALQPDGKLLAAGYSGMASLTGPPNTKIGLARFNTNGTSDVAFGTFGRVTAQVSNMPNPFDVANKVAIQDDGKIVIGGHSDDHLALLRYQVNGTLDAGFGSNGIVTDDQLPPVSGMYINGNDKLFITGMDATSYPGNSNIIIAKYNENGTKDSSIGNAGVYTIDRSDRDQPSFIAAQSDQKIIVAGHTLDAVSEDINFTLFRFINEDEGTDIDMPEEANSLSIYPNPATNKVYVQLKKKPQPNTVVRIVTLTGQVVYKNLINTQLTDIATTAFAPGVYMLQLLSGDKAYFVKFEIRK